MAAPVGKITYFGRASVLPPTVTVSEATVTVVSSTAVAEEASVRVATPVAVLVNTVVLASVSVRVNEVPDRAFWSDPGKSREGEINHRFGGRGLYTLDPGGTVLAEFITTPYS